MKQIFKYLFLAIFILACHQTQKQESSTTPTEILLIDSPATRVDSTMIKVDTKYKANVPFHKPTLDEIADSRIPYGSVLRDQSRPLTQAEIEEDEFYEEYLRQREIKRKEKARKRALKLLNTNPQ